jgi:hypothetical protein
MKRNILGIQIKLKKKTIKINISHSHSKKYIYLTITMIIINDEHNTSAKGVSVKIDKNLFIMRSSFQ